METEIRKIKQRVIDRLKESGHILNSWDIDTLTWGLMMVANEGIQKGRQDVIDCMDQIIKVSEQKLFREGFPNGTIGRNQTENEKETKRCEHL